MESSVIAKMEGLTKSSAESERATTVDAAAISLSLSE